MGGAGGVGGAAAGGGVPQASQFADYGGVDPSLDPELAMALRISLEEARANQLPASRPTRRLQRARLWLPHGGRWSG